MALAILRFLSVQNELARFRIDTGTNPYYLLKIGKGFYQYEGWEQLDGISWESPMKRNEKSDAPFNTGLEVAIPTSNFSAENCFVQLFSFKDEDGTSPAMSKVVKVPLSVQYRSPDPEPYSFSRSLNNRTMYQHRLNPHRNIPYAEARSFSAPSTDQDKLRSIIRLAGSLLQVMIAACQQRGHHSAENMRSPIGLFNTMIEKFLNGWCDGSASRGYYRSPFAGGGGRPSSNRYFAVPGRYGRSFTATAANTTATTPAPAFQDDALIRDLYTESEKEAMLKLLLESAEESGATLDMNLLLQFLQTGKVPPAPAGKPAASAPSPVPAATAPVTTAPVIAPPPSGAVATPAPSGVTTQPVHSTPAPSPAGTQPVFAPPGSQPLPPPAASQPGMIATPVATAKSWHRGYARSLSSQVILSFEAAVKHLVNGKEEIVYNKKGDVRLRVKLQIAGEAPANPLPKAIFRFFWKDGEGRVLLEKSFKEKVIAAGVTRDFLFTQAEMLPLPTGVPVSIAAEVRWLTAKGKEVKALGHTEVVLAEGFLAKSAAGSLPEERELTDMNRYRPFWNKVWEAPLLEGGEGTRKKLWELNAQVKYCVLLSGAKESNGLMTTKLSLEEKDADSVTDKSAGRLKGGIELSIAELNKLAGLWNREPLDALQIAALAGSSALTSIALDCVAPINLKGKAAQRGMLWGVPVLRLQEFLLNKTTATDESGLVTAVEEQKVHLPVPVSVRFLGIKST